MHGKSFGLLLIDLRPDAIATYLGCLRSRTHVPLLVNPATPSALLADLVDHYRPDWVAAPPGIFVPGLNRHHEMGAFDIYAGPGAPDASPPAPDLALLLSTSGSTGSRKLVRLSYRAIQANALSIVKYLQMDENERTLTTLPLAYSFGMSILNTHLATGGSLVLTRENLLGRRFWEIARETAITSLSGVPSTFDMLRRVGIDRKDLPSLRTLTQAGGAMRKDLKSWFNDLARAREWRLFVMYGQTEAAPRISYVPPEKLAEKLDSIGIPIPGGALEIDPGTGELIYSGPNVMMGYAETRADFARDDDCRGSLRTGDIARRDRDGYFYLEGRLKRFIKLSGVRLNLDTMEARLQEELGEPVLCTGNDEQLRIWALAEANLTDEKILGALRFLFDIYPGHALVERLAAFPLSDNGKIDYRSLSRPTSG